LGSSTRITAKVAQEGQDEKVPDQRCDRIFG
jgi:hypothetical protein